MPTAAEKQALVFLTAVALMGGGVRVWQNHQFEQRVASPEMNADTGEGVDDQLHAIDDVRTARKGKGKRDVKSKRTDSGKRVTETTAPTIVDIDVATADEIEKLPHIGAALSQRIVANRDSLGGFGSLDELGRVRGMNKAVRSAIESRVTFSAPAPRVSYADAAAELRKAKPMSAERRSTHREKPPRQKRH